VIRIAVVDDHKFYRELISQALTRQSDRYDVVAEVGDAEHAIAACEQHTPDLLILDINLPGMSGVEAVPAIRNASPKTRILLCTAYVDDDRVIDALRSGAHGFVEKTNSWDDFIEAVNRVARGEQYFCSTSNPLSSVPSPAKSAPRSADQPISLSPREREVLAGIARGSTTKEIAAELGLSFGTVDTHRTNLMRKLGIRNIAGLVVYAFRIGLIDVGSDEAKQRHMPTKAEQ
jgi:DNA-binding NarL/FixJ family response regulator